MNLIDILNPQRSRNTYTVRQERIKREGSPYYTWTVPALAAAASAEIHVPTQFPDARKYEPLDWIEVTNAEVADALTLTINGDTTFPISISSIRTIDNMALWNVRITNIGAVVTTLGKIVVTLQRQPLTIDKWARSSR